MTNLSDKELRKAILLFDKSRGQTGADYVTGKITRRQADSEFEDDIAKLIALFHTAQQQLLTELLGQAVQYNVFDPETQSDDPVQAIPVTAIQKYLDKEDV